MAGRSAPAPEVPSWPRLGRLKTRAGCQVFCRAVHSLSALRTVATGTPRAHGDRSDRAHRRPLPISAAPHDPGVSGVVEVSQDTDRRASVRNVERAHVKPALVTSQLTRAEVVRQTERICPLAHFLFGQTARPVPRSIARACRCKHGRAHARSAATVTRRADARCFRHQVLVKRA